MKEPFVEPQAHDDKSPARRLSEVMPAMRYAQSHTGGQVLHNYLSTIYFRNGAYGAEAAHSYSGITADRFGLAQAANLAGLIRFASNLDPLVYPKAALAGRNGVLADMVDQGLTSEARYERALKESLKTHPTSLASSSG